MDQLFLAFIPIFVAVDAIGLLPIFMGLTQDLPAESRRRIIVESMITALALAVGFIFLGKAVFRILGISMGDFMIAGGLVLLGIALMELLLSLKQRSLPTGNLGAVPLGTPLLVGPGVLTTSFIVMDQYGLSVTLMSIVLNILFVGALFASAKFVMRILGEGGAKALSKVMALLLAAIAVMMIRKGFSFYFSPNVLG